MTATTVASRTMKEVPTIATAGCMAMLVAMNKPAMMLLVKITTAMSITTTRMSRVTIAMMATMLTVMRSTTTAIAMMIVIRVIEMQLEKMTLTPV